MTRSARLVRDVCLGLALLAAAGCGGGSSSSTSSVSSSSQAPVDFDFGSNNPRKVTAFGDSITEGVLELQRVSLRLTTSNNYPNLLQGRLQGLDPSWRVVNRGRGGEHTGQGVGRLPSTLAIDKPGYVLILEGSNDAHQCHDKVAAVSNLQNMVRIAKASKSIPILGTVPPSFRNNGCADEVIEFMNINLRGFAAAEHVVLAEIFNGMNDRSLFGISPDRDPLHPNEAGYAKMADIWFQAMQRAIPGGTTAALRRRR
ncbi:MAG TPA: GDSL-type esterase/lipase family protein [Methylomirabilota bacterium]|jgi:lysophospholipase L1-like esterase|nr:GDSL-type esterase/lipase family protein [Methylomirabilota bacterium]